MGHLINFELHWSRLIPGYVAESLLWTWSSRAGHIAREVTERAILEFFLTLSLSV
jgi:hypothetical protein